MVRGLLELSAARLWAGRVGGSRKTSCRVLIVLLFLSGQGDEYRSLMSSRSGLGFVFAETRLPYRRFALAKRLSGPRFSLWEKRGTYPWT